MTDSPPTDEPASDSEELLIERSPGRPGSRWPTRSDGTPTVGRWGRRRPARELLKISPPPP
jgi:hypothetical protein